MVVSILIQEHNLLIHFEKSLEVKVNSKYALILFLSFLPFIEITCMEQDQLNHYIQRRDLLTSLISAAIDGDREIVQNLLAHGADMNLQWYNGETALALASEKGYKEIVELLLAHGANVDLEDGRGDTALIKARMDIKKSLK